MLHLNWLVSRSWDAMFCFAPSMAAQGWQSTCQGRLTTSCAAGIGACCCSGVRGLMHRAPWLSAPFKLACTWICTVVHTCTCGQQQCGLSAEDGVQKMGILELLTWSSHSMVDMQATTVGEGVDACMSMVGACCCSSVCCSFFYPRLTEQ